MRRRHWSSRPGSTAMRAAISRSRSALRQSLSEAGVDIRDLSLMILKELRKLGAVVLFGVLPFAPQAPAAQDEALLGAHDSYRAGLAPKPARYAKKLEGHVL